MSASQGITDSNNNNCAANQLLIKIKMSELLPTVSIYTTS